MLLTSCKHCGKKNIADMRSHIRKHGITWQEYQKLYGEMPSSLNMSFKIPESEQIANSYQRQLVNRIKR